MKEQILKLLQQEIPEIDFTESETMVDDGILDSLSITTIITAFTMEFGIEIPYEEVSEENFNSLDGLVAMVERLQQ